MESGQRKAYGAGLLSSIGELEYACRDYKTVPRSLQNKGILKSKFVMPRHSDVKAGKPNIVSTQTQRQKDESINLRGGGGQNGLRIKKHEQSRIKLHAASESKDDRTSSNSRPHDDVRIGASGRASDSDSELETKDAMSMSERSTSSDTMMNTPEFRVWDPAKASAQAYPITTYQPIYYVAKSLRDAEAKISAFGELISRDRKFSVSYDEKNGMVRTDVNVQRLPKGISSVPGDSGAAS
jgi:hypothetical protein